jgi:hypothetical protein
MGSAALGVSTEGFDDGSTTDGAGSTRGEGDEATGSENAELVVLDGD